MFKNKKFVFSNLRIFSYLFFDLIKKNSLIFNSTNLTNSTNSTNSTNTTNKNKLIIPKY